MYTFFELLYSKLPRGEGDDHLTWKLTRSGVYDVCSYYNFLSDPPNASFPWKSIWCVKAPKRVYFSLCTTAWDRILTIDNLVKGGLPLLIGVACVDVMGKLWTSLFAHALWSEVFLFIYLFFLCLGFSE